MKFEILNPCFPMSADPRPTPSQSLADLRLDFSPSYVLVGVYRLSTDASIRVPVWKKCKHGFVRGVLVGLTWVSDDRYRRAPQPTPFPCPLVSPGVLHVRNSKELHPVLPGKVRSVPMTHPSCHSFPPPPCQVRTGNRSISPLLLWLYRPL